MLVPTSHARIFICTEAVDMRKSFSGLYGATKQHLKEDPASGALFVFSNRLRTMIKVLYYDRGGYCIWSKRLDKGSFEKLFGATKRALSMSELLMLIDGVCIEKKRKRRE
jgi:transposase